MSDVNASTVIRYGNPVIECGSAQIRALSRQLATVVTVSGTIGPANVERITAFARRFILGDKPFVLDLSGIESITAQAATLLTTVAADCERAGVEWAVVDSEAVEVFLDCTGLASEVPVADSVPDALEYFGEVTTRRRTMLLPLLTRTA
jgi:anti-anti-sigma factor